VAKAGEKPVPNSPLLAREALDRDLPLVLRGVAFERSGWSRPDPLTLLVPMWGQLPDAPPDFYLLRLNFAYYPEWPPSARFVNPVTLSYDPETDKRWVPKIENSPRIQTHAWYNNNQTQLQLICSSMTLEFYLVLHGVEPQDLWTAKHRFSATLGEIEAGLRHSGGYRSRFQ
jgi:hypothetical protein